MILIFGGTTEGRIAVEVCEEAGKPFYYSTKGDLQMVEMHNGVRLVGVMTKGDIVAFCKDKGVRCIVDAAHPFAEHLHITISECGLPVIRLQRDLGKYYSDAVYCHGYEDAVRRINESGISNLLALSGVNTIAKLSSLSDDIHVVYRILNREESREIAKEQGIADDDILYYNNTLSLPTIEEEKNMMRMMHCDAIITKQSGESGGLTQKVEAALELGIKVFIVEAPTIPQGEMVVSDRYSLRRAIETLVPNFFPYRQEFA